MAQESQQVKIVLRMQDLFTAPIRRAGAVVTAFTRTAFRAFGSLTRQVFTLKGAVVGLVTAFAARAGIRGIGQLIDQEDELAKTARSIGSTTEELSKLKFAVEVSGIAWDRFREILSATARQQSQALRNAGEQREAFQDLGVSVDDLRNKGGVEIFLQMARGLEKFNSTQQRGEVLSKIYTRTFRELQVLFEGGEKGLRDLIDAADFFGATISTRSGQQAERFNDTMLALKTTFAGLTRQIVDAFLPTVTQKFAQFATFLATNKDRIAQFFINVGRLIADFVQRSVGGILKVAEAIGKLVGIIRTPQQIRADLADIEREINDQLARTDPQNILQRRGLQETLRLRQKPLLEELALIESVNRSTDALRQDVAALGKGWEESGARGESALERWLRLLSELRARSAGSGAEVGGDEDIVPGFGRTTEARARINELIVLQKQVAAAREQGQARDLLQLEAAFTRERLAIIEKARLEEETEEQTQQRLFVLRAEYTERAKKLVDSYAQSAEKANDRIEQSSDKLNDSLLSSARAFGSAGLGSITSALGDLTDRTRSWGAAFQDAGRQITRALIEIAARLAVVQAIRLAVPGLGDVLFGTATGFAHGGVTSGLGLAGVTNGPTLVAVGEGRQREAVVPLPDNRSIPVRFTGGGDRAEKVEQHFHINFVDTRGAAQFVRQNARGIASAMVDQAQRNTPYRRGHGL